MIFIPYGEIDMHPAQMLWLVGSRRSDTLSAALGVLRVRPDARGACTGEKTLLETVEADQPQKTLDGLRQL